jgi:hypothetical protein
LDSKTKEISTSQPPPPRPAFSPSSFDQEHEQDIHEKDGESYQPLLACKTAPNPKLYQIAALSPDFGTSAGLWWDSFEEEPDFDWNQCFEDGLTLNEGKKKIKKEYIYFNTQILVIPIYNIINFLSMLKEDRFMKSLV